MSVGVFGSAVATSVGIKVGTGVSGTTAFGIMPKIGLFELP